MCQAKVWQKTLDEEVFQTLKTNICDLRHLCRRIQKCINKVKRENSENIAVEQRILRYSLFHKTLPRSSLQVHWFSVRFYEMGDRRNPGGGEVTHCRVSKNAGD